MTLRDLDSVVLARDLPDQGLRAGDLGTVVHVYPRGGVEVEFMTASGDTVAVVTLTTEDVRPPHVGEMVAVRPPA